MHGPFSIYIYIWVKLTSMMMQIWRKCKIPCFKKSLIAWKLKTKLYPFCWKSRAFFLPQNDFNLLHMNGGILLDLMDAHFTHRILAQVCFEWKHITMTPFGLSHCTTFQGHACLSDFKTSKFWKKFTIFFHIMLE
jgi:hypothetical protein